MANVPGPTVEIVPGGWTVLTTDPSLLDDESFPTLIASNEPFSEEFGDALVDGKLARAIVPATTMRNLTRSGCVVQVMMPNAGKLVAPDNPNFQPGPILLSKGKLETLWEGSPREGLFRFRFLRAINDRYVTIDVVFGTDVPPVKVQSQAQQLLDSLDIPSDMPVFS